MQLSLVRTSIYPCQCVLYNAYVYVYVFTCEQRVSLLENWRDFETHFGTAEDIKAVASQMPERVKKRRLVTTPENPVCNQYIHIYIHTQLIHTYTQLIHILNIQTTETTYLWPDPPIHRVVGIVVCTEYILTCMYVCMYLCTRSDWLLGGVYGLYLSG